MCRVMRVHLSGFYAWMKNPLSARSKEDLRLLQLIRTAYDESNSICYDNAAMEAFSAA